MAKIYLPTDGSIGLLQYTDGVEFNVQMRRSRAMRGTTRTMPGTSWRAQLTFAQFNAQGAVTRGRLEAFLTSLHGGGNELVLWHPNKPVPLGTLQANTTTNAAAAAGASTVLLNATTGLTLLAGDRMGIGGTIYLAAQDATSVGGVLTVPLANPLRAAVASAQAVTLLRPTLSLVPVEPWIGLPYQGAMAQPISLEMVEL